MSLLKNYFRFLIDPPKYASKSIILNLFGYQIFRFLLFNYKNFKFKGNELYINSSIFDDFIINKIKSDFNYLIGTSDAIVKRNWKSTGLECIEFKITKKNREKYVEARRLHDYFNNLDILKAIPSQIINKEISEIEINLEHLYNNGIEDIYDEDQVMHSDRIYPSAKAFYFVDDVKIENGPFFYVKNTTKIDINRLKSEYFYSIDYALNSRGLKTVCNHRVSNGRVVPKLEADTTRIDLVCKAGTLCIANVMGYHGRGNLLKGNTRKTIRIIYYVNQISYIKKLIRRKIKGY